MLPFTRESRDITICKGIFITFCVVKDISGFFVTCDFLYIYLNIRDELQAKKQRLDDIQWIIVKYLYR